MYSPFFVLSCISLTAECNDDFTSHMNTMNLQGSQKAESKKQPKSEGAAAGLSRDTKQEAVKEEEEDVKPEESIASRVRRRHGD